MMATKAALVLGMVVSSATGQPAPRSGVHVCMETLTRELVYATNIMTYCDKRLDDKKSMDCPGHVLDAACKYLAAENGPEKQVAECEAKIVEVWESSDAISMYCAGDATWRTEAFEVNQVCGDWDNVKAACKGFNAAPESMEPADAGV